MENSNVHSSFGFGFIVLCLAIGCSDNGTGPAATSTAAGTAGMASTAGTAGTSAAEAGSDVSGGAGNVSSNGGSSGRGAAASTAGAGGGSDPGGGEVGGGGASGAGASGAGAGGGGAGGTDGGSGAGGPPGPVSDWQFYGRWDLTQPGKAVTVNSGSHITASFSGTGISAKFDTSRNTGNIPTVSIKIDTADLVDKEISSTLVLASNLAPGMHTVTLFARGMNEFDARWKPPLVASTVFLGFTVVGGNIVPMPRPKRLKMEFLGDSITEGVNMDAKGPAGQTTRNWQTDGPRGYASLTPMKLGAEYRQVGFGSQGISKGGSGGVPNARDAFNWFYAGVARDDWQADVVVINQGTNDRTISGAAFSPLYSAFLAEIRKAYPEAKIVCLRPFVGAFGNEIQAQVQARKTSGDAKVFYIDTGGWTVPSDFRDSLHPTEAGSIKIAGLLATALMPILN